MKFREIFNRMSGKKRERQHFSSKMEGKIFDRGPFEVSVHFTTKPYESHLDRKSDVFKAFLANWDQEDLNTRKEYQLIGLDKNKNLVCHIQFTPKRNLEDEDLLELFSTAKSVHVKRVIVGENEPFSQVEPNPYRRIQANLLKQYASKFKIDLVDQMIISDRSFFSFAENEDKKPAMSYVSS